MNKQEYCQFLNAEVIKEKDIEGYRVYFLKGEKDEKVALAWFSEVDGNNYGNYVMLSPDITDIDEHLQVLEHNFTETIKSL